MTTDGGDRFLAAPRFDVVLRGYDRRQVDEYLARLQRVIARLRADLEIARSDPGLLPPTTPSRGFAPPSGYPQGQRPRPQPWPQQPPRPPAPGQDVVGGFTDRMQSILRAAEEEAAEIRRQARVSTHGDERLRAQVANLAGERDAVLAELTRMRSQVEGLRSGSAAAGPAAPESDAAWGAQGPPASSGPGRAPSAPRPAPSASDPPPAAEHVPQAWSDSGAPPPMPSRASDGARPSTGSVQRPESPQPRPSVDESRPPSASSIPGPRRDRPSPAPRPARPGPSQQPLPGEPSHRRPTEPVVTGTDPARADTADTADAAGAAAATQAVGAVEPGTARKMPLRPFESAGERATSDFARDSRPGADDLFQPAPNSHARSGEVERTVAVRAVRPATTEQPVVEPPAGDGADSTDEPGADGMAAAAESVAEASDAEDTVIVHAAHAGADARPEQPDEESAAADPAPDGTTPGSGANGNKAANGNGTNGNNGASRPTSAYRAG